jgi:choline monooxygenase
MKPIERAETLSTAFYTDRDLFNRQREIFETTWQYIGDAQLMSGTPYNLFPTVYLPKYIDEPLLMALDKGGWQCLSNVCTHRGFLLFQTPQKSRKITCGYHGRRFSLDGKVEFMPEFKEVEEFPRPCDHLAAIPLSDWSRFLFASLSPEQDFNLIKSRLEERLYFLDINQFRYAPEYGQTYNVNAHWALYVDNYLEGFHIPFVHETLGKMIDYGKYTTECYDDIVLQIGYSDSGSMTFDLPEGHIDYGQDITAYYYWVYPNFMLNFYPWGVQINIVKPIDVDFTKVEFHYFIKDEILWERMGKDRVAEKTEREDEYVVEGVQLGMKSRYYDTGRYSVKREKGVFYFHSLIRERFLSQA